MVFTQVTANIDHETGFPRGGNRFNCGTWMDKMGSSERAGNRGLPATPRDGSAVELVGLCFAVVNFFSKHADLLEGCQGVTDRASGQVITWTEWAAKIQANFERLFWIPTDSQDPSWAYNSGTYRDCVGSSLGYSDHQLRPNFLVAMVLAPELFDVGHAWTALQIVKERLCGPVGMCTLSRDDMAYRGDYDNSNDSDDFHLARGYNYHQMASRKESVDLAAVRQHVDEMFANLDAALMDSAWRSLPELTNSQGSVSLLALDYNLEKVAMKGINSGSAELIRY
ncbi:hypothetical protein Ciccas_002998 [Cichlidogyrus casuarinus]|uniref:Glycogen debranching enzyme C-terminal domain-containing protein n=1 Tax=Cichlidogyrus casuarinus TaxID=1844966 RepID=A0ABD2QIW5_9PLAT